MVNGESAERSGTFWGFLSGLKSPWLFTLFFLLFLVDLLVPDPIPFVDEILLGVLSLILGQRKKPTATPGKPPEKNVTPEGG